MEDIYLKALLFDYYGELLTEQQRRIYKEVYFEDCSESEVATTEGISRQGVHDSLTRTKKYLDEYEKKLGLVAAHTRKQDLIGQLRKSIETGDKTRLDDIIKEIENL
ncbi:MAG: DNA-binding protein [Lachnospiraceae bacterium]|nr:DNA-binding protein [Candidatus Minthocola equi]